MEGLDLMAAYYPTYDELKVEYRAHFTLSNLNTSVENRLALVGLICYLTSKIRLKKPDTTPYMVIMKIMEKENIVNDEHYMSFIRGLAVMCEDMMLGTTEHTNFGLTSAKEISAKVKEILMSWLPF